MVLSACILRAEPMQFIASGPESAGQSYMAYENGRAVYVSSVGAEFLLNGNPVRMKFADASQKPQGQGLDPLPGRNNYFLGKNPLLWRTDLPRYARVQYHDLYPGIDLVYYGNEGNLEYDLIVSPYTNPSRIGIEFNPAGSPRIALGGDFVFNVSGAEVRLLKPVIYQNLGGVRKNVPGRYILNGRGTLGSGLVPMITRSPLSSTRL